MTDDLHKDDTRKLGGMSDWESIYRNMAASLQPRPTCTMVCMFTTLGGMTHTDRQRYWRMTSERCCLTAATHATCLMLVHKQVLATSGMTKLSTSHMKCVLGTSSCNRCCSSCAKIVYRVRETHRAAAGCGLLSFQLPTQEVAACITTDEMHCATELGSVQET